MPAAKERASTMLNLQDAFFLGGSPLTRFRFLILLMALLSLSIVSQAQRRGGRGGAAAGGRSDSGDIAGSLTFRSIGPALTSGRVIAFAVNSKDSTQYFVAAAC